MKPDWLARRGKIYRRWLNAIRVEQKELARHGIITPELAEMAKHTESLISKTADR